MFGVQFWGIISNSAEPLLCRRVAADTGPGVEPERGGTNNVHIFDVHPTH